MIWVNHHSIPTLDPFFVFMTFIGDGLAYAGLILGMLWFSFRKSIQAAIIFLGCSLFSQTLKNLVFPNMMRPLAFFHQMGLSTNTIRFIPGVQIYMQHSFPSGHSITGFSLALLIAFWINWKGKGVYGILCLGLGVTIAYSRIYLFEHFFLDIYVGSILGVVITLILYHFLEKASWLNKSWGIRGLRDYLPK